MSNFPHLLKRTNFASFDPAITRVYASTPHSSTRHGDWGLKYPITRAKGPRYIKFTKLDVGHLLGSDWQSAETEARFIQSHGRGKTPWTSHTESTPSSSRSSSKNWLAGLDDDAPTPGDGSKGEATHGEKDFMRNVNGMTPGEFEKYLRQIRNHRQRFLSGKLEHMIPEVREQLVDPEERTYANLAVKGYMTLYDVNEYQVALTESFVESSGGREGGKIQSIPHRSFGAAYSKVSTIAPDHNALLYHPGRALDPVTSKALPRHFNRTAMPNRTEGTNKPWVVSVGGVTGESRDTNARANDGPVQTGTDFTRDQPDSGQGMYKFSKALIRSPPRVLNLPTKQKPLDTFAFDIIVTPVTPEHLASTRNIGTRAFTAAERPAPVTSLGKGGAGRTSVMANLRNAETARRSGQERTETNRAIKDVLAKLIARTGPAGKAK